MILQKSCYHEWMKIFWHLSNGCLLIYRRWMLRKRNSWPLAKHTRFKICQLLLMKSRVDEFKFLGLWIDSKLSFNAHVDKIKRNAVPFVTVFWKMARFIPMKQWRTVASMAPIWSNYHHNKPKAQQTWRAELTIVQKWAEATKSSFFCYTILGPFYHD